MDKSITDEKELEGYMIVSVIVAMEENRGIGKENSIPWRISSDLKRFKKLTMGHHIIMGRLTFESIDKVLPGRRTIIVTRNKEYTQEGCYIVYSLREALILAESNGESEVFIIGGGEIFSEALDYADRIYLTMIHASIDTDVYFPKYENDVGRLMKLLTILPMKKINFHILIKNLSGNRSCLI